MSHSAAPLSSSALGPNQRLLVRGVNWLGDSVMTLPALIQLRQKYPQAEITILVSEKLEPFYSFVPEINRVIPINRGDGPLTVGSRLAKSRFDTALVFPASHRAALEVWLAGIPRRIGAARFTRNFLLTKAVPAREGYEPMQKIRASKIQKLLRSGNSRKSYPAAAHHFHQYLHLVAEGLGASAQLVQPHLEVATHDLQKAAAKFGLNPSFPVLGLNPGAEYGPAKRWPAEAFVEAARDVLRQRPARCIIFGATADKERCEDMATAINTAFPGSTQNLAGKTSLTELIQLVKLCNVLVTNDTGPMHLASALQTPMVAIFGSTSPELTGPCSARESIVFSGEAPCAPCFLRECPADLRCLKSIAPAEVARAALGLLQAHPPLPCLASRP